jgi:hypothetical protein
MGQRMREPGKYWIHLTPVFSLSCASTDLASLTASGASKILAYALWPCVGRNHSAGERLEASATVVGTSGADLWEMNYGMLIINRPQFLCSRNAFCYTGIGKEYNDIREAKRYEHGTC